MRPELDRQLIKPNHARFEISVGKWLPKPLFLALLVGCGGSNLAKQPIFVDGRAVAAAGDSLIGLTSTAGNGLIIHNRFTNEFRSIGSENLVSPVHVQESNDSWYVSDVRDGKNFIVVLSSGGELKQEIDLSQYSATPHQFAVLPDGRIVIEAPDGKLRMIDGDNVSTFAETDVSEGTSGLVVAAVGGVLHAIRGQHITLYNEFGNIRWRVEWPWDDSAYPSDVAVDAQGRPHIIAGIGNAGNFVVYSLSTVTGEVLRWSPPGPAATYTVERLGRLAVDEPANWIGLE